MTPISARNEEVTKYWLAFYTDPDRTKGCLLCGNRGLVTTYAVGTTYCFCPNGQVKRSMDPAYLEPPPASDVMTPSHTRWAEFMAHLEAARHEFGCSHTPARATIILENMGVAVEPSLRYFRERGGFCDCEIIFNVRE